MLKFKDKIVHKELRNVASGQSGDMLLLYTLYLIHRRGFSLRRILICTNTVHLWITRPNRSYLQWQSKPGYPIRAHKPHIFSWGEGLSWRNPTSLLTQWILKWQWTVGGAELLINKIWLMWLYEKANESICR